MTTGEHSRPEAAPRKAWRKMPFLPALALCLALLSGCAAVSVRQDRPHGEVSGDVLTTGELGRTTRSTLMMLGIDVDHCQQAVDDCLQRLRTSAVLSREERFSAMAEIALADAMALHEKDKTQDWGDQAIADYLEVAQYAYAYLFRGEHTPAQRALEDRQATVRDFYHHAVEQLAVRLFERRKKEQPLVELPELRESRQVGSWNLTLERMELRLSAGAARLSEIVPTSRMSIEGMRNVYGRDGLGAPLVAVAVPDERVEAADDAEGENIGYLPATMVVSFPAASLDELLVTRQARIQVLDPYQTKTVVLEGIEVPLGANYTAPYALWLARSGFGRQAIAGALGGSRGVHEPRLFMMQPYDPNRLTVIMLHGIASSPEAWVNMANEVLGDEALRDRYQVWQVYYPTNLPVGENRKEIGELLEAARSSLDPGRSSAASHDTVLIGHSMGGVLARLLVVDSGDRLWMELFNAPPGSPKRQRLAALEPYLTLRPTAGVSRAIFLASPHAGAPNSGWLLSLVARLVRLPKTLAGRTQQFADMIAADQPEYAQFMRQSPNAIRAMDENSPYIRMTSKLDIAPGVTYHSIIARKNPDVPLEQAFDGIVPYPSAHLPGADSELVVTSGHSVQENPEAILEIRRILREHARRVAERDATPASVPTPSE